ncbi:hypothetical protein ASG22_08905 [Chryseobacterium sp. Leaf405]|uniref:hypothetical protein n=1 Tax=Chryseobacterium sp. Leaf405 TaxID=1736367 RepID=UPI0006F5E253|nr:hypothetical protein [Chryseobacterium sp. Leaf405]KQT24125.1 hypothetical protein ASG22_08905 [Chryseobacterium sp. Leaf405]
MKKIVSLLSLILLGTTTYYAQVVGINTPDPGSTLQVNGSLAAQYRAISATTYAMNETDFHVSYTGTGNATFTLPAAINGTGNFKGRLYTIKNNTAYTVVINPAASETIGNNTAVALGANQSLQIINTGLTGAAATWEIIDNPTVNFGDVKMSFSKVDHHGWVLLDGRLLSTLTSTQQAQAATLGFTTNLPDATNRVMRAGQCTNCLGSVAGSDTVTLTRANLPDVNFTGSTGFDGAHNHSVPVSQVGAGLGSLYVVGGTGQISTVNGGGNHSHSVTVSSGGSGTAFNTSNPYMFFNAFVYLGS